MGSRREFLGTLAAAGVAAWRPGLAAAAGRGEIKTALGAPVGLQLWSLREFLPKDLPGTLAKVREMGFRDVESAGLWGHSLADTRAALDRAGLRCRASHMPLDRLQSDAPGVIAEAKALGSTDVVCAWIMPPEGVKGITRDYILRTADTFNRFGAAAHDAGLRFGYHCHGYEFVPSPEGTLFDTLAGAADAKLVDFQIDTFHAWHGGADPAQLIAKHGARVRSLHLKDEKRGFAVEQGSYGAPPEADVPLGTGQLDFPAILREAKKAGAAFYFVEDESTDPLGHIPQSVAYLEGLKL